MSHQPPHPGVSKSQLQLREYAYYRTGGTAAHVYQPETIEQLAQSVKEAHSKGLPLLLLGGGTNSLVLDEPFAGAAILFRRMEKLQVQGQNLVIGAGIDNSTVALSALKAGLSGAAWMYRLPGQMGGTVRMNARCYGGEISQIVKRVVVVTTSGEIKEYRDRGVFRGYKDTVFMETGDLIAEVELELTSGDRTSIERAMIACETDRASKGQFLWPSCGCVFKNDYQIGVPSGMLLEASGVKSFTQGGAAVSQYHANFVYNTGASSRDIFELTHKMREAVFHNFGVWLEYEMEVLGSKPSDLESRLKEKRIAKPDNNKLALLKAKFAANQTKP
jgi:UDP-N-acetylmuramate dehydrogenase